MENYIEQRAVDLEAAVVVNKAELSEPIHEEADPRAGCADHFRQRFLTDLGHYSLGRPFLPEMSEQQKNPCQPLFARIEKLVNQILFVTDVPRQQIGHEQVREFVFPVQRFHHGFLVDSQNRAIRNRGCGAHAERLACERTFAEEVAFL